MLVCSFFLQTIGHSLADLDPLGISNANSDTARRSELGMEFYGFSDRDLDREFTLPMTTFIGGEKPSLTLREIIARLNVCLLINYIEIAGGGNKDDVGCVSS